MPSSPPLRYVLSVWVAMIVALALANFGYMAAACQSINAAITKVFFDSFVYALVFPLRVIASVISLFAFAHVSTPFLLHRWPMPNLLMPMAVLVSGAGIFAYWVARLAGAYANCSLRY